MNRQPLRLLLVEDSESDAALVLMELRRGGFAPSHERVETESGLRAALQEPTWDLVICDYVMPAFSGLEALKIIAHSGLDIPFFLVSGTISEDQAVSAMKAGAHDYLLKSNLLRLCPAVTRELREAKVRIERRQAESALRESQERFRQLVESTRTIPWEALATGFRFLYVGPQAVSILGYDPVACCMEGFWHTHLHPEDRAEFEDRLRHSVATGEPFEFECRFLPVRGPVIWLLGVASLLTQQDGTRLLRGFFFDTTERKQAENIRRESEERYRLLVENSNDLVAEIAPDGTFLYTSPNYQAVLGYTAEDLAGQSVFAHIHPEDVEKARAKLAIQRSNTAYRYRPKTGAWHWLETSNRRFRTSSGEERCVIISRDVTAPMQAEEARKRLELQLRQAQKMEAIGTLAGGIAHDFNNILTGIIGNTQLAELETTDARLRGYLNEVMKAGSRARDLVAQILTFSRQREQLRAVTHLSPIVQEALKLLRATLPSTIEIRTEFAVGAPQVLCDASQIHQVIMNLGTNAAHAMRERGGVLTVTVESLEVDDALASGTPQLHVGKYVRLTVRDTGCGMDAATLERIFDPFFTTKGPGEGTGLGLAVVHGIVQNHDAAINVYSERGRGTVFHLYFPAIEPVETVTKAVPRAVPRGQGQRILFVDDETSVVDIGIRLLERLGYKPRAFSSSQLALDTFKAEPDAFDAVISDLTMPGVTGTDLARHVLELRPDLPFLVTTGYMRTSEVEKTRKLGVRTFIEKPFTMLTMAETLQKVFAHPPQRNG